MKCIIPSQNVKILARAIHSLAKVGDEMFIVSSEDDLVLRTINATRSAFSEFRMCRSFFSSYSYSASQSQDTGCKVTMKSCISVFKNTHGMDKQVENCEIRIKPENTQVIFQLKYINSSVKKHYLPIIENDQLEATIPTEAPNQLCASSKFLSAALKNFRQSEDEISLAVGQDKTTIKNHLELKRDANLMRTELSYHQTEFENYVVGNPTNVTFCLKELRAVIMFAEPSNLPVLISFTEPGRPIVFQVQNHPAYEANYVVSTLEPSNFNRSSRSRLSATTSASPLAIRTLASGSMRRDSLEAGYSFQEESAPREPFIRSKRKSSPQPEVSSGVTTPMSPEQRDFAKTIRFHLGLPSSQESGSGLLDNSMPSANPVHRGLQESGSGSPSGVHRGLSPQPCSSRQCDDLPTNVSVVSESEASHSLTQSSLGSVCRVETRIHPMDTSSQPSPELLKTVFSRCFSKDHFLNVLVGHDHVLEESSDREMV